MNSTTNPAANNNATQHSNIKVYLRFRPINPEKSELPISYDSNNTEIVLKKANQQARSYCFDGIFNDQSTQSDLSEVIIDPFIQQVIEGFNCTVLAYGQTGTGKTYTIQGDDLDSLSKTPLNPTTQHLNQLNQANLEQLPVKAGLVPRAFSKLFNLLQPDDEFKVSVIEIYNEEVYDLLSDNTEPLRIYECQKGVTFNNLKEFTITNAGDLNTILQMSDSRRQFASTLMNKRSSRSHVIYQYTHHRKETLPNGQIVEKVGKLNLVDLAGSECAKRTGCQDMRALEAGNINRSLLTLTRVIDALVKNQKYIPFRSSNLTRIIQDTLGGNSKTVLVATLSPALIDFEDTLSTLTFASTVKQVKNTASANIKVIQNNYYEEKLKELEENLVIERSKYEKELAALRAEADELKAGYEKRLKRKADELEETGYQLENKDDEIQALKSNLTKLTNDLIESKMNQQKEKENEQEQPAAKKRKSTKPLSNAANKSSRVSLDKTVEDLSKQIKNDVNFLSKEHNLITRKVNKLKSLIADQELTLKESSASGQKEQDICADRMEENLSSLLHQMFNIVIQDEFDLFHEYLVADVQGKLSDEEADELEEKFSEFKKGVDERLEFVSETANNTLNSNEKKLEKKNKALGEMNKIAVELSKEIKELVKIAKKSKDKVRDMKNALPV